MTIEQTARQQSALRDLTVLVMRASGQADELSALLRQYGVVPVEMATIEIVPNPFPDLVAEAIDDLARYDWVVFTSRNGVEVFVRLLCESGRAVDDLSMKCIAAVGKATAAALEDHGIEPDLVPERFDGDAVLEAMLATGVAGQRILLPRAEVAREVLPDGLRAAGATVDVLPVYRTVPAQPDPEILERLKQGEFDIVTCTSSSTVKNLISALGGETNLLKQTRIACIGPITADTARSLGLEPWVIAIEHTIPGLVDAICNALEAHV
jgi:uroporphyrinogen-III synthase